MTKPYFFDPLSLNIPTAPGVTMADVVNRAVQGLAIAVGENPAALTDSDMVTIKDDVHKLMIAFATVNLVIAPMESLQPVKVTTA